MNTRRIGLAMVLVLMFGETSLAGGVGVLGDSYSDEYQFYAPHRSTARNWVEILAQTRDIDFGAYSSQSRGEPRNEGYAYNWARSDASTADMIATGQHTGLAAQVTRGEVSLAVVFIGGNDAIHALYEPSPSQAMKGLGRRAAENVETAVRTLLTASPDVKVLLVTVPDIRDLPEFRTPLRDGKLDRSVAEAAAAEIDILNASIRRMARNQPRVAILDMARITRVMGYVAPDVVPVGNHKFHLRKPGNAIDHLFLGDVRHLGTIGQGMFAKMVVDALNTKFRAGISPLSDREIVGFAERMSPPVASAEPFLRQASFTQVQGEGR